MIVYGYRNKEIEAGRGSFYCPKCETQRQYKFKKITRYFTLFFIPLFPIGTVSQYIECSVCGRTYKPEILSVINSTTSELATGSASQNLPGPSFPAQTPPQSRSNSCLPWVLIGLGIIFFLAGGVMGIGILGAQYEGNSNSSLASLILALIVCPGGLAIVGALGIGAGFVLLRNKPETLSP